MEIGQKRRRKDITCVSKRHLRRLAAQESDIVCNIFGYEIPSHDNVNDKCTTVSNNSCTVNSEIITIEHNRECNEIFVQNDDMLRQFEDKSNSQESLVNTSYYESSNVEFENENITDFDLQDVLAVWAVQHQITHTALTALLHRLKKHPCFSTLSLDARSVLKTPRQQEIRTVVPGSYYHFGLLYPVKNIIASIKENVNCVNIAVNIDGLPLFKSSQQQFWPILGSVLPYNNVFLIGIYHGNEKPADANDFLQDFVNEAKEICENGIYINGRNISCRITALICDAPAKAYVLCVKGHTGYSSCTKCTTEGEYIGKRMCFPEIDAPLRSDNDFVQKKDDDYHKSDTTCSLLNIPYFKPVTNVPLDCMHLIFLGIMRKLLYLWLYGDLRYRLQYKAVDEISTRLVTELKCYIPGEFVRKPRKLDCVKLWKATEYRLIMLYTGPLAFKSMFKKEIYFHFITLHVIIRILSSEELHEYINYAQDLIHFFIKTFIKLYGIENVSHNVHNLVHLVDDVKRFGPLENFSAFKFENYLQILKRYLRKADKSLQQVVRRCIEKEKNLCASTVLSHSVMKNPKLTSIHCDGPLVPNCRSPQYKIIQYNGITFKAGTVADSCCGLSCGAIVCIKNVAYCSKRNTLVIIGLEFLKKEKLFSIPCPSSLLGIHIVHTYSDLKSWPLKNVTRKYVQLPYGNEKYAVFPLLHGKI
ncbi:PREDICTED: uncharacterized protein LOC105461942 [Wasmannia auropunctata]|uniref:uncharacterized protein LOC105461942 n=1 Tax=Wasmannia auropunctata TaxID=64793 RepID=UPI0005EE26EF|nr:PREDICTED: uncharacterized protein LOC105461942 [Wasmannia auropunctata]